MRPILASLFVWSSSLAALTCARVGFEVPNACAGEDCAGHGTCGLTPDDLVMCACDPGYRNRGPLACEPVPYAPVVPDVDAAVLDAGELERAGDDVARGDGGRGDAGLDVGGEDDGAAGPTLSGQLDPSFDGDGVLVYGGSGTTYGDAAGDVTIDASDGIVAVASTHEAYLFDVCLFRFQEDGAPDPGFGGGDGQVTHSYAGWDWAFGIHVTAAGRIVVAGSTDFNSGDRVTLFGYLADGSVDTSFGVSGGYTRIASGSVDMPGAALGVDPSTGGYCVGAALWDNQADTRVARFLPNGGVDAAFGGSGVVTFAALYNPSIQDVKVDAQSRCVVVGAAKPNGDADLMVARFNPDGSLDSSFDHDGYLVLDGSNGVAGGGDSGNGVLVLEGDDLVVVGASVSPTGDTDMVLWRLHGADGSLDLGFGGGRGYAVHDGVGAHLADSGNDVERDARGNLVVAGFITTAAGGKDMAVWRYTADGVLDTSLAGVGYVTYHGAAGGNGSDVARRLALDTHGRAAVMGTSQDPAGQDAIAIWRLR